LAIALLPAPRLVARPLVESDDPTIQYYYDFSTGEVEFDRAFAALTSSIDGNR
jgi:hypothetical protein